MKKHLSHIMSKNNILNIFCAIALAVIGATNAYAFSTNQYATNSKLERGKWVKITIPEDGIYQLTYDELREMGFNDPSSVRIYGTGGHPISEILDGSAVDDLKQTPSKHFNDKICFYACGPVDFSLTTPTTVPHYTRNVNTYSQAGYYFITSDATTPLKEPSNATYYITGQKARTSSLDYVYHEQDLISASQSGKEMLGEEIVGNSITMPYYLHNLCPDSLIVVNPCVAARSENATTIFARINDDDVNLNIGVNKIYASTSEYVFYNMSSPSGIPSSIFEIPQSGNITMGVTSAVEWARLNYFIITFYHENTLAKAPDNQLRMGFNKVSSSDIIAINDATQTTQLWNINNPNEPRNFILSVKDGITGFTPLYTVEWDQFIAFNPDKELKSITGYEEVENQNIHALPTPDMVIVTCEKLLPQAERIAQMHRDHDNMTVHVLDQQKIFNEFSSGTPDAMGIRLMNKMFYDRDRTKFKNVLMFGAGSFDNRQLIIKNDCAILTYESIISNDENNSYVSDDFFGMLDDGSGANIAAELLRIGIGRIPSASVEEAQTDVDKLINYVTNPDYGPWRNNALFVADYVFDPKNTEKYLHEFQAEGIGSIINDELNIGLINNKVFVTQFPKDPSSGYLLEGRKSMKAQLESGQFFMTYVGHANPNSLTKEVQLWTSSDSKNATYPHLPIVTAACCDVIRYDGGQRGLMEMFFHKPNGGAIAMVATTRAAYSNGNDALNQAFTRALFCFNTKGHMPTLGEAYMLSKQSFGAVSSYNRMMFSLLGDPAMKVNYPKPYFKVTKINGYSVGTNNVYSGALQQVTVEAKVYTPDGNSVDYTFNGSATLTIYDYQKKETTYNNRDINHPRKMLTQINGRVQNGVFVGVAVIPRFILNPGKTGLISVYAHRDNSDEMVSGSFDKLILNSYNPNNSHTIHDDTPPTINAIYFNDQQEFEECILVAPNSTLHINATDDYSFNNQTIAVGNSMVLKIDGGKTTIPDIKAFASLSNNGKNLDIAMPLDIEAGYHTLEYTVFDAAGNTATQTLNFAVGGNGQTALTVDEEPAVTHATFNFDTTLATSPDVYIKVFNFQGTMKWFITTSSFPYEWNLKTRTGVRLPPGVYTYYGKYNDGTIYGGTSIGTIIIADPNQSQ